MGHRVREGANTRVVLSGIRFTQVTTARLARLALAGLALAALAPASWAQSVANGQTAWNNKCDLCHGAPAGARANAADAPAVIVAAINNNAVTGMGGVATTSTERSDIAAYLESVFNTTPLAANTSCNNSVIIPLAGDLEYNTPATALTTFVTVSAPAHGTLSYNTTNEWVTYTPAAGNANDVSFSYRLRNAANTLSTSTRQVNVAIARDNQTITFPTVLAQTYNPGGTFGLSATSSSGLTVTYASSTPSICTVSGSTVTEQGAGTCTITASQTASGNLCYNAATPVVRNITINKASQTITFPNPPAQTYAPGGTFALTATASSGLTVTYSSTTPAVCTVAGSTVTKVAGGTCTINANQAGNADYFAAAQVPKNITISPASQTITFPAQTTATQPYSLNGTFAVAPNASASSSLIVAYGTSTPTICSVTGNSSIGGTVTKLAAGICTITANQAGSASYGAATQQTQNVTISATAPGTPTIGVGTAGDASATIAYTLNANTGGLPITKTRATCNPGGIFAEDTLSPFTAITVTGLTNGQNYTCSVTAFNAQGTSLGSATVGVTPSQTPTPPVINSPANTTFTVGSLGSFQVTASGFPAPTFSFTGTLPTGVTLSSGGLLSGTPALGTVANYSITITAANGNAPNGTQSFQLAVQKANQTISFTPPATQPFSAAQVPLGATATSGLAVTYTSQSPGVCTVSGSFAVKVTVGTCVIQASQPGNANFNAATPVVDQFDIVTGSQTITFNAQSPLTRTYSPGGTFPLSPAASASSILPVSYQSITPDTCSISGTTPTVTIVAVGVCTIEAMQLGDANYDAATPVQRSVGIVKADQAITFPAQPQQNFVANGTFAISPLASTPSLLPITYNSTTISTCTVSGTTVTIVAVGTCTIAANQAGDGNWNAAPQVTRNLQIQAVVPGAPTIGTATPGNGQATIEFTPPAFTGGAAITSYTATCQTGNFTGNAAGSPVTVTGLANGVTYSCTVTANNTAGSSLPSAPVDVTPAAIDGAALWGSVCISCHGPTPAATRLNGGGTTSTVIEYVRANQPSMVLTPAVQALSPADLAAVAAYIAANTPPIDVTTAPNQPKTVSVASGLTLGTISFTDLEIVTPPANGTLGAVNGTEVVYTPNNGFTGTDTFTYRGKRTDPTTLLGDPRTATIHVVNGAPLLTVSKAGTGQGTVFGLLPTDGITCGTGTGCVQAFAPGEIVSLVAVPGPGSIFTGWSGACTGTDACDVTMDASKGVTATFALDGPAAGLTPTTLAFGTRTPGVTGSALTATLSNTGTSTLSVFSFAITGPHAADFAQTNTCAGGVAAGDSCQISVTFTPSASSARTATLGFGTDDPANPAFSINLTGTGGTLALSVATAGTGTGGVTSNPSGITCPGDCSEALAFNTPVVLTATPTNGSTFTGWSGACGGTGACNVTMSTARSVTATFTAADPGSMANLSVTHTGAPSPAFSAKDVMYTITVANAGPATATNVVLTDLLPAGTAFIWAFPGCVHNAGTVTCPIGSLANGASAQRKIVVRPAAAGSITNTATVGGTEVDPDNANNASNSTITVNTSPAGVAVTRYRLFSPVTSEHLYTTDLNEYNVLGTFVGTWIQEGAIGKVYNNPGTFNGVVATPYYRLYNTSNAQHHWTTDPNEFYTLILFPQYNSEGVDGYIFPTQAPGTIPLFRLLYPFSVPVAGLHHWTIDANEYNALIASFGWVGEGGSGFVIP